MANIDEKVQWNTSPPRQRTEEPHSIIDDAARGTCSALERACLREVERARRLPTAQRQVRSSAKGTIYRGVEYPSRLVVELDGRIDHTGFSDRGRDLDRDLAAAIDGRTTVRLGWAQVVGQPCETAVRIHRLLRALDIQSTGAPCEECTRCGIWTT